MKLNAKGFTLIELLAVIVILAIIALIATPIVLGILGDARKSAAVDSTYGVMKAAELEFARTLLTDPNAVPTTVNAADVNHSGKKAEGGTISFDSNGKAQANSVVFGTYTCSSDSVTGIVTC